MSEFLDTVASNPARLATLAIINTVNRKQEPLRLLTLIRTISEARRISPASAYGRWQRPNGTLLTSSGLATLGTTVQPKNPLGGRRTVSTLEPTARGKRYTGAAGVFMRWGLEHLDTSAEQLLGVPSVYGAPTCRLRILQALAVQGALPGSALTRILSTEQRMTKKYVRSLREEGFIETLSVHDLTETEQQAVSNYRDADGRLVHTAYRLRAESAAPVISLINRLYSLRRRAYRAMSEVTAERFAASPELLQLYLGRTAVADDEQPLT